MSHLKSVALIIAAAAALAVPGMALAAPPPNDDFADAHAISGLAGTVEGTNVEATYELDEPDHAAEPPTVSVWYRWTAPGDGAVTFDLCGSDFDTILAVYTGSALASLTGVAANDDSFDDACGFRASRSTFTAVAGTEYLIAVDGYLGDTGSFVLRWSPPRPTNLERPAVSGAAAEGGVLTVSAGQWQSGLATTLSYQWQRCGRLDYPAANVALGRPGIATTSHPEHPPAHAVDGNLSTFWSSDAPAPQRIEIDLGAPYPVNRIRSAVMQSPDGFTDHRILGRGPQPGDAYQLLTELSGNTSDNQVLEWVPTGGWVNGVQFIRSVRELHQPGRGDCGYVWRHAGRRGLHAEGGRHGNKRRRRHDERVYLQRRGAVRGSGEHRPPDGLRRREAARDPHGDTRSMAGNAAAVVCVRVATLHRSGSMQRDSRRDPHAAQRHEP